MANAYFLDSSALGNRYVIETGTAWVRRLTRRNPSTIIYIAHITAVEVACAIARRRAGKTIAAAEASSILRRFDQHIVGRYTVIGVTPALLEQARRLGRTHALRAYGAVQLAVALEASRYHRGQRLRPGHSDLGRSSPQRCRHGGGHGRGRSPLASLAVQRPSNLRFGGVKGAPVIIVHDL